MASSTVPKSDKLLLHHLQGANSSKYFDFLCNEISISKHLIEQTLFTRMTHVFYHAYIINHNEMFREFYMFCRSIFSKQNTQSYAVSERKLVSWIDEQILKLCRARKTSHLKKMSSFPFHIFHTISHMIIKLLLHLKGMENDHESSSDKPQDIYASLLDSLMKLNKLSPSLSSQKKRRTALKSVEFFCNVAEDYTYLGGNINPTHLLFDIKQDIKVWCQRYCLKLSLNSRKIQYPSSHLSHTLSKKQKCDSPEQQSLSQNPVSILKKPPVLALTVSNLKVHTERWSETDILVDSLSYQSHSAKNPFKSSDKQYLLNKMAVADRMSNVSQTISHINVEDNWFQTDSSSIGSQSSLLDVEDSSKVSSKNFPNDSDLLLQHSKHKAFAREENFNSASDHSPTTETTLGYTADRTDESIALDPETSDILAHLQDFSINENTNLNTKKSKFFTNNFTDSDTDESIIFDPSKSSPVNIVVVDNDWSNEEFDDDFLYPMSSSPDLIENLSQTADYFYEDTMKEEVTPEFQVCITLRSSFIQSVNSKWSELMMDVDDTKKTPSKVSFATDDNLCQVHLFDLSEPDLFSTSEILDQIRFRQRIKEFENIVTPFLAKDHRNKVCQRNSIYIDEMF